MRPGHRPLSKLPVLAEHETELERCAFCPKLCRSACPVSNEEPRETLIPWGKMTTAWHVARGDLPIEPSTSDPAWACTGCMACREACDHRNDVAGTLFAARAALVSVDSAPVAAKKVIGDHAKHDAASHERARALSTGGGPEVLLVGCTYLKKAPEEARAAVEATTKLLGHAPRVLGGCCGLPLLHAGDHAGFLRAVRTMIEGIDGARTIVLDPGCAVALRSHHASLELLVELAASRSLRESENKVVRWHDPCQLGRGLGVYDAPREILAKVLGRPPLEFEASHEHGRCSGAGGLLPLTMPEVSRGIAKTRIEGVTEPIVTGCASSLVRFRSVGADASDIVTLIARAL